MTPAGASKAALAAAFPALAPALAAEPVSRAVIRGGAVVDIDFGAGRLYREDARAVCARQLEAFQRAPHRWFRLAPVGDVAREDDGGYGVSGRMMAFLTAACAGLGIDLDRLPAEPDYAGGVLVVLGVGLGYHLADLIRHTRARTVVLYEPFAEFFHHAAGAIDWQALLDEARARDIRVSLVATPDPEAAAEALFEALRAVPKPFIDGTWLFTHYPAQAILQVRDALGARFPELNQTLGGVEDELKMFGNTLTALKTFNIRILDGRPVPARPEPVFIIGAGPSLTADLEQLRQRREGALVFSCGTALRVLLRAGIVPDFQCDTENVGATWEAYCETARDFAFTGITLAGALTVDTRSRALFTETWGYFREAATPTRMLSDPARVLVHSAPNVANTALRLAVAMGFTDITLFGIDLGVRAGAPAHAQGTVYESIPRFADHERALTFPLSAAGNFGGEVGTTETFVVALDRLARVIAHFGLRAVNCSDGVRIGGAQPRRAAALPVGPPLDRARIKDEIAAQFPVYAAGTYPFRAQVEAAATGAGPWFDRLDAAIRAAAADGTEAEADWVGFYYALAPFIADRATEPAAMVVSGSLTALYKLGAFFLMRIREPEPRAALFRVFLEEFAVIVAVMRVDCLNAFERALA